MTGVMGHVTGDTRHVKFIHIYFYDFFFDLAGIGANKKTLRKIFCLPCAGILFLFLPGSSWHFPHYIKYVLVSLLF